MKGEVVITEEGEEGFGAEREKGREETEMEVFNVREIERLIIIPGRGRFLPHRLARLPISRAVIAPLRDSQMPPRG